MFLIFNFFFFFFFLNTFCFYSEYLFENLHISLPHAVCIFVDQIVPIKSVFLCVRLMRRMPPMWEATHGQGAQEGGTLLGWGAREDLID